MMNLDDVWQEWLQDGAVASRIPLVEVSTSATEIVFELDEVDYVIKAAQMEQDLPWRFEMNDNGSAQRGSKPVREQR